jgi:hypothetical protein
MEFLAECRDARLSSRVRFGKLYQDADASHPLTLLRPCRKRPRRRAAEKRDELASSH